MPSKNIKDRRISVSRQTTLHPCYPDFFTNSPACIVTLTMVSMSTEYMKENFHFVIESIRECKAKNIVIPSEIILWSMISSLSSILYTVRTARNPQSLLTVLFMETQLVPIQRADGATALWLRPAQCLPLSYHPFFPFLLPSSVSVSHASISFL